MTLLPKDPPIIDRKLLARFAEVVTWCEHPEESWGVWFPEVVRYPSRNPCLGPLQVAHIRARGMGGGRRKDVPSNLARLCMKHHQQFDAGQSRKKQEWLKAHIQRTRPDWVWRGFE